MFMMLPLKERGMYFKTLISKHNKYILNKLQQLIQSQRLKNVFTVWEGAFKNMNDWIRSNLHTDLIKYITDSQVDITNYARRATNELMKQGVKPGGIQYYNNNHISNNNHNNNKNSNKHNTNHNNNHINLELNLLNLRS